MLHNVRLVKLRVNSNLVNELLPLSKSRYFKLITNGVRVFLQIPDLPFFLRSLFLSFWDDVASITASGHIPVAGGQPLAKKIKNKKNKKD